jgi:hypothetical protein
LQRTFAVYGVMITLIEFMRFVQSLEGAKTLHYAFITRSVLKGE